MSQQLICDDCGQPIDQTQPYYTLSGTKVQMVEGSLTVVDAATQLDYHAAHLPGYKVAGEEVVIPPAPSVQPPEDNADVPLSQENDNKVR